MLRWIVWQGTKDWARWQLPVAIMCGMAASWTRDWIIGRGLDTWLMVQLVGFVVGMSMLGWLGGTGLFLAHHWWRTRKEGRMPKRDKDDRAWTDYSKAFREHGLPKIMSSSVTLSLYTGDGTDFDVKQATELGAMLLLDKPLILLSTPGSVIPSRLARAADYVIEDWGPDNHDAQLRLTEALLKFSREI